MIYEDWLAHFNPNHDPQTGRFSKKSSSIGLKNLKNAKTANLNKWGSSPDTNVLYITGYSGSGKSTTALSLAKPNDTVIHLDLYSYKPNSEQTEYRNEQFNKFLSDRNISYEKIANSKIGDGYKLSEEYWKQVDALRDAIMEYGREQYKNGNRVIVEGIQIADEWLGPQSYFTDKPLIILTTDAKTSRRQANVRDGINIEKMGQEWIDEIVRVEKYMSKKLNELAESSQSELGVEYLNDFLKQYGDI